MSGLEGLAALGLASNIFQVVSFGCSTIKLIKHVYQNGPLDDAVYGNAAELRIIANGFREGPPRGVSTKSLSQQDKNLLRISEKCYAVARDLQEEINFIGGHSKRRSLSATVKVAAKANWRKRRLDRMEADLQRAESTLQTGLLDQIWFVYRFVPTYIEVEVQVC